MANKPKSKTVHVNLTIPEETDEAISALANEWGVSKSAVMKLMMSRGLSVESARRLGYTPQFQSPDKRKTIAWPDDRPTKKLPFGISDWRKGHLKGPEGDSET